MPDWEMGTGVVGQEISPEPVRVLLRGLGLLPYPCGVMQIVGSKGKGTTAEMVSSLCRAHGLKVGLLTSPHLRGRSERTRVDGQTLDGSLWEEAGHRVRAIVTHKGAPEGWSRFEVETAMALWCFARLGCDVVVLEAGMGGVGDATSALPAQVVGLTSVELEHTRVLGGSIEQIIHQKAGVVGAGDALFLGPLSTEARRYVRQITRPRGAALFELGMDVAVDEIEPFVGGNRVVLQIGPRHGRSTHSVCVPLLGPHIPYLAALAVGMVRHWLAKTRRTWRPEALDALAHIELPARLQRLSCPSLEQRFAQPPTLVLDVAHTPHSVRNALEACLLHLDRPPDGILLALNRDKRCEAIVEQILAHLPRGKLIFAPNPGPRSAHPRLMLSSLPPIPLSLDAVDSVEQGWEALLESLPPRGLGLILGSFRLADAILHLCLDCPTHSP